MRALVTVVVMAGWLGVGDVGAELMAGVGVREVTPPVGGPMYGYAARGANVSTGVHDPLYAKALVLSDGETRLAVATLDLGSVTAAHTAAVKALVKAAVGIEDVLLVASHTHSAPRAAEDFPSAEAPWIREAEVKIAEAIIEAAGALVPARIGAGWGEVKEGHNRRMITTAGEVIMLWGNRERYATWPVDYSLGVIRVESVEGDVIANLVNFACHPVVLGPENLEISADYVGVMMETVEDALGGQCMFLAGAAGDINPFWDKTPPEENAFDEVARMGRAVGAEAARVSRGIVDFVEGPVISVKEEVIALAERQDRDRVERPVEAGIMTVLIGKEIALGAFPGEFFVEHGLALKERSRFPHTFFVGYANDALGYFPTIQAATEGGYGAATATRVEVGAGERLVNRALVNLYYQGEMISP